MAVTINDIGTGVRRLGLQGRVLCVHSSLRSFGQVEGRARTVVDGLLAEGCTVLVPTFSSQAYEAPPPLDAPWARNGFPDTGPPGGFSPTPRIYAPTAHEIDSDMGAIPTAVLSRPRRRRSPHPIRSFAAAGPLAADLIPSGASAELFDPLSRLAEVDGSILLMGVGLDKMTAIHLAEERAGRRMFRRWVYGPDDQLVDVEVGGCSDGFIRTTSVLCPLESSTNVGESLWRAFPAGELIAAAAEAIQQNPDITRCDDDGCVRCGDAILGGPIPRE